MSEPISIFQRRWAEAQAKRQHKEPVMTEPTPFETMSAVAKALVARGQARDFPDAVDTLRLRRHPSYLAWMGHSSTPPAVHKTAVPTPIAKHQAVVTEVERLAKQLVMKGAAVDQGEAIRQVLYDNPALYKEYQRYPGSGPVVDPAVHAIVMPPAPTGPVYEKVQAMARELMADDLYGRFAGMDEQQMMGEVFKLYPSLWSAYRAEVSGPGEDAPPPRKR